MAESMRRADRAEVAPRLRSGSKALEELVAGRAGPVELVPSRGVIFALIGDLGDRLELVWTSPDGVFSLDNLVRTRGLAPTVAQALENRLRWCCASHLAAPRRPAVISGRPVCFVASDRMAVDLRRVVTDVLC